MEKEVIMMERKTGRDGNVLWRLRGVRGGGEEGKEEKKGRAGRKDKEEEKKKKKRPEGVSDFVVIEM